VRLAAVGQAHHLVRGLVLLPSHTLTLPRLRGPFNGGGAPFPPRVAWGSRCDKLRS
jgi:hypothetical protein